MPKYIAGRVDKTRLRKRPNKYRFLLNLRNGVPWTFFIDTRKAGASGRIETVERARAEKGVLAVVYVETGDEANPREALTVKFDPDP